MPLHELLRDAAEKYPRRDALLFGERRWTYAELEAAVRGAARGFSDAGIRPGDRVGILLKNSPEFVISVFALAGIGAAAVPLNFMLTPDEIGFMCLDSGTKALVTQSAHLESARKIRTMVRDLATIWVTDPAGPAGPGEEPFAKVLSAPPAGAGPAPADDALLLVLYTSGTTGRQKGAMLTHSNLLANVRASIAALGIDSRDRFLCLLPMFHVFAWTTCLCIPLSLGCPVTIVESIRPPRPWLKLMFRRRITVFAAVPQIYAVLAEQAKGWAKWLLRLLAFGRVRFCISGAAPLLPDVLRKFEERIGRPLLEGYGLSETSPVVSVNTLEQRRPGSVGRTLPDVSVKIDDGKGRALPSGEEGEICVRGPNVMRGYLNQPEATKEVLSQDGWFRTGDVGMMDAEGFLFIRDRIKDMIISKGLKIYSMQVEETLLGHPAVAEAAVVGLPNPSGDETIKGFVVLKAGMTADKSGLLRHCQERLPPYKRPRDIEILDELPKNSMHKVLKRELRRRGARRPPEGRTE